MKKIHGGDVYNNHVTIDFSVNINPLSVPEAVKRALHAAVDDCVRYPDIAADKTKSAISDMHRVPEENILVGNGASELFMAIVHGIKPKKTVIPVPSFYGYEYVAEAVDGEVCYYEMKEENGFFPDEDFFSVLTEDIDLLFLANPNNPTGRLMSADTVRRLLCYCRERGIYVVLDECFLDFCEGTISFAKEAEQFRNLIIVRAFTKIFAIPGVRLGYLICANRELLLLIERQLPEWNLSVFAQKAACACAFEQEFIRKTVEYVRTERQFLEEGLRKFNIRVLPGQANFLLIYSVLPLYDLLLKKQILIRDCATFRGLHKGYYRIAVKSRAENESLLKALGEICR